MIPKNTTLLYRLPSKLIYNPSKAGILVASLWSLSDFVTLIIRKASDFYLEIVAV